MCDIRTKCVTLHKEYSDVLQVPDSGNVLEEFVIRDVAKNLVVATEVTLDGATLEIISTLHSVMLTNKPLYLLGIRSSGNPS
jgi:hypothetical protein